MQDNLFQKTTKWIEENRGVCYNTVAFIRLRRIFHRKESIQAMKLQEVLDYLRQIAPEKWDKTCDKLHCGNPDTEIRKIAACFKVTIDVVRQAAAEGVDLLITHEPLFCRYDHAPEADETDPVVLEKWKLLQENHIAVFRYHDHAHLHDPDFIHQGFLEALAFDYIPDPAPISLGVRCYTFAEPHTAREIAERIREKTGASHPRIAGSCDKPLTRFSLGLGSTDAGYDILRAGEAELFVGGEISELGTADYAKEADSLGMTKAMIILGHCESEREGMKCLARHLEKTFPALSVIYLETGSSYTTI